MTTRLVLRRRHHAALRMPLATRRAMPERAPIISRPSATALPARLGWQLLCALMWTSWLLCWGPLLTLGIWEFGIYRIHETLAQAGGMHHLRQMLGQGAMVIAVQSACLLGWAGKDFWRYGAAQRRRQAVAVSLSELAQYAQIPGPGLAQWQLARCVVAEHDERGVFVRAQLLSLPGAPLASIHRGQSATIKPTSITQSASAEPQRAC